MIILHEQTLITDENITSCVWHIPYTYAACCIPWNKSVESELSRALLKKTLCSSGIKLGTKDIAGGAGVRPYITGKSELYISLSHCHGLIACAFGKVELGIDVENIRTFDERVMKRVCSRKEIDCIMSSAEPSRMFFRCWTLKESYGKAMGVGLNYPMRETVFFDGIKVCNRIEDYAFTLYENINGYIIALCHKKDNK